MSRTPALAAAISLLTMLTPAPATAQPAAIAIDAMQPLADLGPGTLAIGGPFHQRLAQTFTVELASSVRGVFLPLRCDSGRLVVEIRDVAGDLPGEAILSREVVPAAHVRSLDFHFQLIGLAGGPSVAPGDRLALVLANPDGSCGIARGAVGDGYGGGAGYFEAAPNAPGWVPLAATETRHDHPFLMIVKVR